MKKISFKGNVLIFGLYLSVATICLLTLVSCSSSKIVIEGGETIVLQQPCYFIDNPGVDYLVPTNSPFTKDYIQKSIGIVPKGVKVKFLGSYAESGYMADTHIRSYGRILEGEFRKRKINMDFVMMEGH